MRVMRGATAVTVLGIVLVACGGDNQGTVSGTVCVAGQACDTGDVCSSLVDGTPCGTGQVCAAGACVQACMPDQLCDTEKPCTVGSTTCASPWSKPVCAFAGNKPDGLDCGNGQKCWAGACVTPPPVNAVARVYVMDQLLDGAGTAHFTAVVTAASGTPSPEVDWSADGGGWFEPTRGVTATFHAPPSAVPAKYKVSARSVADPTKSDFAYAITGSIESARWTVPVGAAPFGLLFRAARDLYVANTGSGTVSELWTSTVGRTITVGHNPRGDMGFDGRYLWVTNTDDNTVSRVDVSSGTGTTTFDVGRQPHGVAPDWHGAVWVVNLGEDTVMKLRGSDGALLGTFPVGHQPTGVAYDGRRDTIWVSSKTEITNLTLAGVKIPHPPLPISDPYGITCADGYVWYANLGSNDVVRVDAATGAAAAFRVGARPLGIAVSAGSVWVANSADDTVTEVDVTTGNTLCTLKTCSTPYDVAVDGRGLYVSCYGSGEVFRAF